MTVILVNLTTLGALVRRPAAQRTTARLGVPYPFAGDLLGDLRSRGAWRHEGQDRCVARGVRDARRVRGGGRVARIGWGGVALVAGERVRPGDRPVHRDDVRAG